MKPVLPYPFLVCRVCRKLEKQPKSRRTWCSQAMNWVSRSPTPAGQMRRVMFRPECQGIQQLTLCVTVISVVSTTLPPKLFGLRSTGVSSQFAHLCACTRSGSQTTVAPLCVALSSDIWVVNLHSSGGSEHGILVYVIWPALSTGGTFSVHLNEYSDNCHIG